MDAMGRDQFYHRWRGHHIFSDGHKAFASSKYSAWDFSKHISLDVITKHGVPLLPTSSIQFLSDTMGISVSKLMPWVSANAFDLTVGVLAVSGSAHDLVLAFTGQLPWGFKTAIFTFGLGGMEVGTGLASHQPLLVLAGGGEVGAGAMSMWKYYSQPVVAGIPVSKLLAGLGFGLGSGLLCSAISLGISWNTTTTEEKITNSLRTTTAATIIGGLSAITPCLSIPVSLGWSFGSLAVSLANDQKRRLQRHPLSSPWSFSRSFEKKFLAEGYDATARWLDHSDKKEAIQAYQNYVENRRAKIGLIEHHAHIDKARASYLQFKQLRAEKKSPARIT